VETESRKTIKMAANVTFHFTKETPGNQMFSDVKALNKFNDEGFKKFVDLVLHFLIGSTDGERFLSDLESFAQEHGASLNPLKNITKTLLTFFKCAAKQNLSAQYVQEDMENLGTSLMVVAR
jgi:hypothetical protein